jgi:hypothetical protein
MIKKILLKILSFLGFKKKIKKSIQDIERLNEFLFYCRRLEEHPFFMSHSQGGHFQLKNGFSSA